MTVHVVDGRQVSCELGTGGHVFRQDITLDIRWQDVREHAQQGEVAVTAEPEVHRGGSDDRRGVERVECLRRSEPAAQCDGADIQARLSDI